MSNQIARERLADIRNNLPALKGNLKRAITKWNESGDLADYDKMLQLNRSGQEMVIDQKTIATSREILSEREIGYT